MSDTLTRRLAGLLLIVVPIAFAVCFTLLQGLFEYPDILRQSPEAILSKFQAGGPALLAVWYVLTLTALLFVPISVLLHLAVARWEPPGYLWVASTFGVLAGVVQTLGFIRWPFLVPYLADQHLAPSASVAQREAIVVVFEAFHRYAGMALGEHLGYLCTALWTFLVAAALWRMHLLPAWLGGIGMVLAVGIALGVLEAAGWAAAGAINAVSYLAWSLWLVAVGVLFLRPTRAAVTLTPLPA